MQDDKTNKILLPHHEQQTLCTTRLAYRQGRKLTAVKVYSISSESNHLLIFGVPSLNLRQETKSLFIKFGKLLQFNISKEHACETFTETYHAQYEKIQSARLAKRMLDTKNFYGGSLHICYAPELENVEETRQKLSQRQQDVVYRLKKLQKEKIVKPQNNIQSNTIKKLQKEVVKPQNNIPLNTIQAESVKLNMGDINVISTGKQVDVRKKRKLVNKKVKTVAKKKNIGNSVASEHIAEYNVASNVISPFDNVKSDVTISNVSKNNVKQTQVIKKDTNIISENYIEVVDCTNIDKEVITNINESLNYNKFGNEIIKKIPPKPTNKIQFHINKKS